LYLKNITSISKGFDSVGVGYCNISPGLRW